MDMLLSRNNMEYLINNLRDYTLVNKQIFELNY